MALLFLIMLYYAKERLEIIAREWDLNMITAGDYTVTKVISEDDYISFKTGQNETSTDAPAYIYMKHLKEKYEREITLMPKVNDDVDSIKIANISFAFNNDDMIKLLQRRGNAIMNNNIENKIKIEKEIDEIHKAKSSELSRPVKAFVTFELQEGYERAKKMKEDNKRVFRAAPEPTNIIWENTHFTKASRFTRTLVVIGIVIFLILLSFFGLILIKRVIANHTRSLDDLNCSTLNSSHPRMFNGIYKDGLCEQQDFSDLARPVISTAVSFGIVFLNYFLREIIINLVKKIGFHTETNQTKVIMIFIFTVQFFNSAFLNLFTNANIREATGLGIFQGSYPDFDFNWYLDIGVPIISTMLTNAFSPLIEF